MSCSDAEKKAIKEKLEELKEKYKGEIDNLVENPKKLKEEIENFKKELDPEITKIVKENNIPDTVEGAKELLQKIMNNPNYDDKKKIENGLKGLLALKLNANNTENTEPNTPTYMKHTKSSDRKNEKGSSDRKNKKGGLRVHVPFTGPDNEEDEKCRNFKSLDETNSTPLQRELRKKVLIFTGGSAAAFASLLIVAGMANIGLGVGATIGLAWGYVDANRKMCRQHYRYSLIYDLKKGGKTDKEIIKELKLNSGLTEEEAKTTLRNYNKNYDKNTTLFQEIEEQKQNKQTVGGDSSSDSSIASSSDTSLLDEESLETICNQLNTVVLPKLSKETQGKIQAKLEAGPEDKKLSTYEKFMNKTKEFNTNLQGVEQNLNEAKKNLPAPENVGGKKRKTIKKGKKKTRKSKKIKKKTKKIKRKVRKTRKSRK